MAAPETAIMTSMAKYAFEIEELDAHLVVAKRKMEGSKPLQRLLYDEFYAEIYPVDFSVVGFIYIYIYRIYVVIMHEMKNILIQMD